MQNQQFSEVNKLTQRRPVGLVYLTKLAVLLNAGNIMCHYTSLLHKNHSTDCQMILSINLEQLVHWREQLVPQDTKRFLGPVTKSPSLDTSTIFIRIDLRYVS